MQSWREEITRQRNLLEMGQLNEGNDMAVARDEGEQRRENGVFVGDTGRERRTGLRSTLAGRRALQVPVTRSTLISPSSEAALLLYKECHPSDVLFDNTRNARFVRGMRKNK
jgi:hypothetical protein